VTTAYADPLGGPEPAPTQDVLDTDAKAVLDWSVPSRYDASWKAWNAASGTYMKTFVNPTSWSVNLDGCGSTSKYAINSYTFTITQLGTAWTRSRDTTACQLHLHILPAQGTYRATLTLHTSLSFNTGVSRPVERIVGIRDLLIVSMGDSLASGEGNSDVPGSYDLHYNPKGEASVTGVNTTVQWKDKRCHRSARSGPALAAKSYEDADPKTSVTFLSVACSGAEIRHLIDTPYEGIERSGTSTVPPQIDSVVTAIGSTSTRPRRQIDALMISAGVNDLHFGDIIERCASNWHDGLDSTECVTDGGIDGQLAGLPAKYDALAAALRAKLPGTREVYLNDYPANVFRGGACGSLNFSHVGISSDEAETMHTKGIALSWKIIEATQRFRGDEDRWNFVSDLDGPFFYHAYCDDPTWFTSYERSWATQGNKFGTAHPNATGHQQYANLLKQAVVPTQSQTAYRHLTLTITAVKLPAVGVNQTQTVEPDMALDQAGNSSVLHQFTVPRNGQWTAIPAAEGTFTLDVFVAPASPRHATGLYMSINHILPIQLTRNDGYGAGSHEVTHPTGSLAVRYTVVVESPTPSGPVFGG
jgi:hypothetical protein